MIFNKKATQLTNIYVIISIVLVVAVFSYAIIQMGSQFATNPNTNLNTQSIEFLEEETGQSFKVNNRSVDSNAFLSDTQKNDEFYVDQDTVGDNPKDFALEFFWGLSGAKKVWNTIETLYNLPSFFIRWLPLDALAWQFVINAFNLFAWASLLGAIIFLVRGYNIGRRT